MAGSLGLDAEENRCSAVQLQNMQNKLQIPNGGIPVPKGMRQDGYQSMRQDGYQIHVVGRAGTTPVNLQGKSPTSRASSKLSQTSLMSPMAPRVISWGESSEKIAHAFHCDKMVHAFYCEKIALCTSGRSSGGDETPLGFAQECAATFSFARRPHSSCSVDLDGSFETSLSCFKTSLSLAQSIWRVVGW